MAVNPLGTVWTSSAVRRFATQTGLVLFIFATVTVLGIYVRTEQLVISAVRQEAHSFLDLVVATRQWNADHGGVWVTKGPGSESNEYLKILGVDPDTSTVAGTALTLRNPAVMTRELSQIVSLSQEVRFRLTSLDPVNPNSTPDAWERAQLQKFQTADSVAEEVVSENGHRAYRMMRPLVTERSCVRCHGIQGYDVGDIRGALSVSIDLTAVDAELRGNAIALGVLWIGVTGVLGFIMFGLVWRMAARIERGESQLKVLATTDELTGLANRRSTMDRLALELARSGRDGSDFGVIELDIDRFKAVNDTHGHPAGDAVLVAVGGAMSASVRAYDIVGRIGGEEFLVVAPMIDEQGLADLAERIRAQVEMTAVTIAPGVEVHATVSAGCATGHGADETLEGVLRRADEALYAAKSNGRNRVERA